MERNDRKNSQFPLPLGCQRRNDLVDVHVRRRARPGLKDIKWELVIESTICDLSGDIDDAPDDIVRKMKHPEVGVHLRRRLLDRSDLVNDRQWEHLTGDLEVCQRKLRLGSPPHLSAGTRTPAP